MAVRVDGVDMKGGLRVVWDPALDGGGWPGPLAGRDAVAGEVWLGPLGLLGRLEVELGLGHGVIGASALERAAELAAWLPERPGWWSASVEADALGTAQRLLHDRDLLALWGWSGEAASERLAGLWVATAGARPGLPDRLLAVIEALEAARPDVDEIELHTPLRQLEPRWQRLFERLAALGVVVREHGRVVATARQAGDLARAQGASLAPGAAAGLRGDGSLTLLRPHGPLAAAEEVAASLAAMPGLDGVLIIGGDEVLDGALARHGLPRLGMAGRPTASSALVRLVIEAAFEPMDAADLHALLCLAPGPVPRRVASRLVDALRRLPSRRAPLWAAKLAEGLERCDEGWRVDVAARVAALLMPAVARTEHVPRAQLLHRLGVLEAWAGSAAGAAPSLTTLVGLVATARRLVELHPAPALSLQQLRRLCDELDREVGAAPGGQAGLAAVPSPEAMLGPAGVVVWWGFSRDAAPAAPRLRLSLAERDALRRLGVTPPDLGGAMEAAAARWRRPLELATDTLVLVCPATSITGEPQFPHPLWDELRSAMPGPAEVERLEVQRLLRPGRATRQAAPLRSLPVPASTVQAASPLPLRERESPSSLGTLLGCSLRWALTYHGRLRAGLGAGPGAPTPLLSGTLAHHLLEMVFGQGSLDGAAAAARAEGLVDTELPRLAETLALPRHQAELTAVRQAVIRSARALGELLGATGATLHGVEVPLEGSVEGVGLGGTADLVMSSPAVVLDLKWGRKGCQDRLENGTALQLAAYATLHGAGPDVAYFTLGSQELLAPVGTRLPGAMVVGTDSVEATWDGALVALGVRREELARGVLQAPASDGSDHKSRLVGGRLALAPDCGYCDFGGLCGQRRCQ